MLNVDNKFKGGWDNIDRFEVEFENEEMESVVKEWLKGGEPLTMENKYIEESWDINLENKLVVLWEDQLVPGYRDRKYQLLVATGGFGVDPSKMGRAVFTLHLGDGERVRWNREQIMGVITKAGDVTITKIEEE